FVAAVLASAFMFAAGQGLGFWLALNTRRTFGLDTAQAASVSGVALLIGGIGGPLVGGWLADWRARRSAGGQLEVVVGAAIVAILACVLALNSHSLAGYLAGLAILVGAGLTPLVALSALLQGIVLPPLRGSATAILGLVTQLLSAGAPYAIGALSDSLGDLRLALLLIVPASLAVGALAAAWGLPAVKSDTAAMEQRWAAAAA
ncbi:MAG TPA: hypothetical protein VFS62_01720, partial [Chloroflexota bacterium]|nr:hypothetical protein [Chloroflexota bacterium]